MTAARTTPSAPSPPVINPVASPIRLPKRFESLPTASAAPADPKVNKAAGTPANALVPSISSASNAPTVIPAANPARSEEHTSELQSRGHLVCRLLLEKKNEVMLALRAVAEDLERDPDMRRRSY